MLSEKMTLGQANFLVHKLSEYHWEHGEEAYYTFSGGIKHNFLVENNIDLTEEEYDALSDLIGSALRVGKVTQADIDLYNDEPKPDNRSEAEKLADRLKEATPEKIEEIGLAAFEIMISDEYRGRYTFDAIWNELVPENFGHYEGESEDPIDQLIEANIEARIEAARNWKREK